MATPAARSTPGAQLEDRLRDLVADVLGDPGARVVDLQQLTGGASCETWLFTVDGGAGLHRQLILRRDPPGNVRVEGIALEAQAMTKAARAGVPVPEVLCYEASTDRLDSPFMVMAWVPGETLPRRILKDDEYRQARSHLAAECGDVLARIHSIDAAQVPDLPRPDSLASLRGHLDRLAEPSPPFELALRWLESTRPACDAVTLVHGDFRHGNLMIGPEGIRAVLDWELTHVGDPLEDLGWLCVRAWRFGSDQPVGGFGSREQLFDAYERRSGHRVDPEVVLWWELFGTLSWGVMCMRMGSDYLAGRVRTVERAVIGRRAWEQEYDVMRLLDERIGAA